MKKSWPDTLLKEDIQCGILDEGKDGKGMELLLHAWKMDWGGGVG